MTWLSSPHAVFVIIAYLVTFVCFALLLFSSHKDHKKTTDQRDSHAPHNK